MRPNLCIVSGLTSEKGKKLNGCFGTSSRPASALSSSLPEQRIPVILDGVADTIDIKYGNLRFLADIDGYEHWQVGAGRTTFRDKDLTGVVANIETGQMTCYCFTDKSEFGRAKANLLIMIMALKKLDKDMLGHGRRSPYPQLRGVLMVPTDLNVARAMQHAVSFPATEVHLGAPFDKIIVKLARKI
jgi:hypothetical protein